MAVQFSLGLTWTDKIKIIMVWIGMVVYLVSQVKMIPVYVIHSLITTYEIS